MSEGAEKIAQPTGKRRPGANEVEHRTIKNLGLPLMPRQIDDATIE
jgi:hypothetical protein